MQLYKMRYIESVSEPDAGNFFAECKAEKPDIGALAMLAQNEKKAVATIQTAANEQGVPLLGVVFPDPVKDGAFIKNGAWLLCFEEAQNEEFVLPVLYDIAMAIGGELSVKPLLTRTLERILHHSAFPIGFICQTPSANQESEENVSVVITAAIGDPRLINAVNTSIVVSKALFDGTEIQENASAILDSILEEKGQQKCFLRLAIPEYGFIFLIGPKPLESNLSFTDLLDPILAHLSRAITLCAVNDMQKNLLINERDELAGMQRLSAKMLDSISSGIFVTDARRMIISVNEAFENLTKYEASFIKGKHPRHFLLKKNNPDIFKMILRGLVKNDNWSGEINITDKDDRIFPAKLTFSIIKNNNDEVTNYMGIFTDVSEKKETDEQISFLTYRDSLTRLPNYASFRETVENNIVVAEFVSLNLFLLSINIDDFNTINNSLGHSSGDKLLVKLADRLIECIMESGVVSRSGADNFLVLLSGMQDREDAVAMVQKILSELSRPVNIDDVTISVTSTIGVSVFPENGYDFDTLYKHANTALKYAKISERSYYKFFDDSMDKIIQERFTIENQLRFALGRNELTLQFQPFVDFKTNLVLGAEVLVRWNNPDLGYVSPGSFIPVAVQSGLIIPIGEWVLMEACKQWAKWRADGTPVGIIAVNVSAPQFKRSKIVEIALKYIKMFDMAPNNLELELTETIMINNTEQSLKTVAELKEIGVTLSLDDFGTGYSSFSYLSRFPLDKLKIDQSFVCDVAINAETAKIVKAIVELGRGLGLKTIAEGIENAEQSKLLKEFGCDIAQGYFYGPPMTADELSKTIDSQGYLIK